MNNPRGLSFRPFGIAALALLGLPASIHAQSAVASWTCSAEVPYRTEFGASVAVLGDLDGDGLDDLAMGLPGGGVGPGWPPAPTPPAVWLSVSGGTLTSPVDGDRFGQSLCGLGDVDGDGIPDLAIGAPRRDSALAPLGGVVVVYSGASLAEIFTVDGLHNGDTMGEWVDGGADVDGDGKPDLLIGAPQPFNDGGGYALLVSGATGAVLRTHAGYAAGSLFGRCVRWLPDLDRDGTLDYAVGAPWETLAGPTFAAGRVRVFSGATGAPLATIDALADREHLGAALASLGDVDRDGFDDFAVGAPSEPGGPPAYVGVYSGRTLQPIATYPGADQWGRSIANAGDWNADGHADIAVGGRASATILSGRDGSALARHGAECDGFNADLAATVAGPCDLDGSGKQQVVIGIVEDNPGCGSITSYDVGTVLVMGPSSLGPASGLRAIVIQGGGDSVSRVGDLNGDGLQDILMGDGRVISVTTREVLLSVPGGRVSYLGDVSGDGVPDVYTSAGVFSGADGSLIYSLGASFTSPNSGGWDLDQDGRSEFLSHGEAGGTTVYSGSDASTLYHFAEGKVASFIEDLNGDGIADIAIADPTAETGYGPYGVAWVRSGADGAMLGSFDGTDGDVWENFGYRLNALGDVDGDGVRDIGAASWGASPLWTFGELHVFSGSTLTKLTSTSEGIPYAGPAYGYAFSNRGDKDGDGKEETAIGSPGTPGTLQYSAVGYGGVSPWDYFGYAVDNLGDVDGDGLDDMAWGAPALVGIPRVVVLSTACLYDRYHCAPVPNSTGASALIKARGSGSVEKNSLSLAVSGLPPGKLGIFFMGLNPVSILLGDGRLCVAGSVQRLAPPQGAGPSGNVEMLLDLTEAPLNAIEPGNVWSFQFWYRDPEVPLGSGFNFSDAVEIEFCP